MLPSARGCANSAQSRLEESGSSGNGDGEETDAVGASKSEDTSAGVLLRSIFILLSIVGGCATGLGETGAGVSLLVVVVGRGLGLGRGSRGGRCGCRGG